ncbi:rhomboid family intramembrane serine protease [Rhodococcus sp. WMMA185]|nr:rhomboid family intramembrane serine protease [Rhodococcus sp. WMMA185]
MVLFAVVILLSSLSGRTRLGETLFARPPRTAVVLWLVVAVPSLVQLIFPAILDALERDPNLIRDDQWWRILTSVAVQGGGPVAAVAGLAVLAWVAPICVRVWGGFRAVLLFVAGQIIFGLFTAFLFPSTGAGNLGATLALAASVAGLVVMQSKQWSALAASGGIVLAGVLLIAVGDAHGLAVLTGTLLGAALTTVSPPPVYSGGPYRSL